MNPAAPPPLDSPAIAVAPKPSAPRVAAFWAVLSALGALAVTPYQLALLPAEARARLPPLPVLLLVSALQSAVLFFLLALGGTYAARAIHLESPIISVWLAGQRPRLPRSLGVAGLLGALIGLLTGGLDGLFAPHLPPMLHAAPASPTPWAGLLASLYGGVSEEVMTRLFLMSVIAWALSRALGASGPGRSASIGIAIVTATLIFGAAHLPMTAHLWPLTPWVVTRALVLNAGVGLLSGALYARWGLEHAIVAHFCGDVVLHTLLPALSG